jgi:hypothetical protein
MPEPAIGAAPTLAPPLDPRRPWLVGETNPWQKPGADPDHKFDLYPLPAHASGGRLCHLVLGMQATTYLRNFVRRDLLTGKWSVPAARKAAYGLWCESGLAPLVLLGAKVCAAFGFAYEPFTTNEHYLGDHEDAHQVVILPHPSGLNRAWHEPGAFLRARELVMPLLAATMETGNV